MTKTFTRSELYELIWFRPRSLLAAEFGISDVVIGKHCVNAHVPGPSPGYWARKQAGRQAKATRGQSFRYAYPVTRERSPWGGLVSRLIQGSGVIGHDELRDPAIKFQRLCRRPEPVACGLCRRSVGKAVVAADLSC